MAQTACSHVACLKCTRNGTRCSKCVEDLGFHSIGGVCVLWNEQVFLDFVGMLVTALAVILFVSCLVYAIYWFSRIGCHCVCQICGNFCSQLRRQVGRWFKKHWTAASSRGLHRQRSSSDATWPLLLVRQATFVKQARAKSMESAQAIEDAFSFSMQVISDAWSWASCFPGYFHRQYFVGVGLSLYYNAHLLPGFAAASGWVMSHFAAGSLGRVFEHSLEELLTSPDVTPAFQEELEAYAKLYFCVLIGYSVILLFSSWFIAWIQWSWSRDFGRRMSTMKNYAVLLQGVPTYMTSESELFELVRLRCADALQAGSGKAQAPFPEQPEEVVAADSSPDEAAAALRESVVAAVQTMAPSAASASSCDGRQRPRESSVASAWSTLEGGIIGVSIGYNLARDGLAHKVYTAIEQAIGKEDRKRRRATKARSVGNAAHLKDVPAQREEPDLLLDHENEKYDGNDHDKGDADEEFDFLEDLRGTGQAIVAFRSKAEVDSLLATSSGFWMSHTLTLSSEEDADLLRKALTTDIAAWQESPIAQAIASTLRFQRPAARKLKEIWPFGMGVLATAVELGGESFPAGTRISLGDFFEKPNGPEKGDVIHIERLVRIRPMLIEAPAVLWYNLGTKSAAHIRRLVYGVVHTFIWFGAICFGVYFPYGTYILAPYARLGGYPGPLTCQLAGFFIGIANAILCNMMWIQAWNAGFLDRSGLDLFTIVFNVVLSVYNTVFNLSTVINPENVGLNFNDAPQNHTAFAAEVKESDHLQSVLVPGWLFSGFLIGNVMGTIVPLVQNYFLAKIIYIWSCFPKYINDILTLLLPGNPRTDEALDSRMAEIIMEPREVALAWDYANIVITPSVCFLSLFFLSPRTSLYFEVLFLWVIFAYVFHRFIRIRFLKMQIHSSAKLDAWAMRLWGLPLSIVSAAGSFWGANLGYLKMWMVPIASFITLLVYLFGLMFIDVERDHYYGGLVDEDYWKARERLRYDWFNTNPVHVLKSRDRERVRDIPEATRSPVPFMYGKERLLPDVGRGRANVYPRGL